MRATLDGLDAIAWERTHPNGLSGRQIPALLRDLAAGGTRGLKVANALLHQGTRFGGAAEALPFLIELVQADETPRRPDLLWLAAGIGAPVEPGLVGIPFDRALLARVSDEELWREDSELLDGFAAMCALDGRNAWLAALSLVSELVDHPDTEVRLAAICVLASETTLPATHEVRLRNAMDAESEIAWHAALALGRLAEHCALAPASTGKLEKLLGHPVLIHRASAAFALAFARPLDERLFDVLAEANAGFTELSRLKCHFEQPLMGMVSRAIERALGAGMG